MFAEPQAEHAWLQKMVGDWTFEASADMGSDEPPHTSKGTEKVTSLGGLWVICEGQAEMPGAGIGYNRMTLGFDPAKGRYVGTWIGSMMANMWVYDGEVSGNTLTLNTVGPSFAGDGGTANYREEIEFVSNDHRIFRSSVETADGGWNNFMTAHYHRTN